MVEMAGGYVSIADGPPAPEVPPGMNFRKNTAKSGPPNDSSFYFRLSGLNLYYTATDKDMVVLGALKISNIQQVMKADQSYLSDNCLSVKDIENDEWTLCAATPEDYAKWKCAIETVLGLPCKEEEPEKPDEVSQPVFIINTPSPFCNENWTYKNKGKDWQCLCVEGK